MRPGFVITQRSDGSVGIDRQVMKGWDFPERSRMLAASTSATTSDNTTGELPPTQQQVLATLQDTFKDLSGMQQSQLMEIQPLAAKEPDTFKARLAALRQATIDSVNAAIEKAYDDLKNAALQAPHTQPASLEAVQYVAQLAQAFITTVDSAFDAADHAGSLVIDGLSEGAAEVANAFTSAGNAIASAGETVADGFESVFSGW